MGVSVLIPYQLPEGKTGPQAVDSLSKRIIALKAEHIGPFLVDCESYFTPTPMGTTKAVHMLHNSEFPATTFAILDTGTGKHIPLVADDLFDVLMMKISPTDVTKKQPKIESKGPTFQLGDFVIKLGSVTIMDHFKGILIEIEYRPCIVFSFCWDMIREMLQCILGYSIPKEFPNYFAPQPIVNAIGQQQMIAKHNDNFEPLDVIQQYFENFTNYRKQNRYFAPMMDFGHSTDSPSEDLIMN